MPKFEEAYYLENENWEVASFEQLRDPNERAILRQKDLRNEQNGSLVLGIRNHPITPHFFQKSRLRTNIEGGVNESDEHNSSRDKMLAFLRRNDLNSFGFYESPWESDLTAKGFDFIIKSRNYTWESEVKFGLIYGKYIIFDILGRYNELTFTNKYPFIAIEIVDTHFHSQESFKVLLELSKNLPIIILYYFVSKEPYLNSKKNPLRANTYSKNRIYHYISDGSFWINNDRIEDTDNCNILPETPNEYYNFILDRLNENDFIR